VRDARHAQEHGDEQPVFTRMHPPPGSSEELFELDASLLARAMEVDAPYIRFVALTAADGIAG